MYRDIYCWDVVDLVKRGDTVYCFDKTDEMLIVMNSEVAEDFFRIIEMARDDKINRFQFYTYIEKEESEEDE